MFAHDRFAELLDEAGYTDSEFAAAIGFSQPTVNRWGTGKSTPDPSSLKRIAAALKVSPAQLWVVPPRKRDLVYYRVIAGYSTTSIARELEITQMQLWRIEKGKAKLPEAFVPRLSALYGVSADRLQHAWDNGNRAHSKKKPGTVHYELVKLAQ